MGHTAKAKHDTLPKPWNNTEGAAEIPEEWRRLLWLQATMLRPFPVWASCWSCVAFQHAVSTSSPETPGRSQPLNAQYVHMEVTKQLQNKQKQIYIDINFYQWLKYNILWSILHFLNVSSLPLRLANKRQIHNAPTNLVSFHFPTEKWLPPTGFKTFIQLQWLHALLVVCLVRHFQIFRGGFLVNNNKWSSWMLCWDGVYFDSVRSAKTSTWVHLPISMEACFHH